MVEKVMEDTNCSLEIAVAWSVSAKKALKNVHGFSPNQLVFGRNPNIPTVLNSKPPALEGVTSSKLIAQHLNAMHTARAAFIQAEASEKLRRALMKKTRMSTVHPYKTGDEVYYKRKDSRRWHGPGIVIGGINKQVFVKHGGTFLRINPCHLQHVKSDKKQSPDTDNNNSNLNTRNEICDDIEHELDEKSDECDFEDNCQVETTVNQNDNDTVKVDQNFEHDETFPDLTSAASESQTVDNTGLNDQNQNDNTTKTKELRMLRNLRPFNKPGKKEDVLLSSIDKQEENKLPIKGSRIRYKLVEHNEWLTANVLSSGSMNEILYLQTSQFNEKAPEPVITSDLSEWEYANEEILAVNVDSSEILEAKIKEIENLKSHNIFTEVQQAEKGEERAIGSIEKGEERAIGSRWVITEKFKDGEKIIKARLVAKGFQENSDLKKDSPTCLKENLRLVVAIAASEKWKMKSLDIKSAFLQGKNIERDVYLIPPAEVSNGKVLWKLNKVIYGLSDASRIWYLKVKEVLESLGMKMSIYDEALFYFKVRGKLCGLIAIHVDDFLHVGNCEFEIVINKIKQQFEISHEHDQFLNYLGLEITQTSDDITLNQFNYISKLTVLEKEVTKKDFKSKIGQLAWVAGQTRPDISFDICQASVNMANESDNMKRINKCIKRLKSENHVLKFVPINFRSSKIVCFADASFANLQNGASQGGLIIFIESEGKCIPLFWQSKKLKRVVKSTLSAETMALMEGAEQFMTDSKSLKDCLSTSKTLEDKRLKVDICVVRDYVKKKEIHQVCWISTEKQLADSLTKSGANQAKLLQVLQSARLQLE
ncbi:hypothetical protein Ahia01_001004000 [Argonauta hians]